MWMLDDVDDRFDIDIYGPYNERCKVLPSAHGEEQEAEERPRHLDDSDEPSDEPLQGSRASLVVRALGRKGARHVSNGPG